MPKYQELTFEDLVQMVEKASSKLSLKGLFGGKMCFEGR